MATIFALSSGRTPAAIAVVRISGPAAFAAVEQMAGTLPLPRFATLRALRDEAGELLDRALVLVFPGPASATGEDVVELQCHGGRAVVRAIEDRLERTPGLRRAEPGEFTRRGLHNARIDLAQAESLADLLEAETEHQRRAALAGTEGRISAMVRGWMDAIIDLSAQVEVAIDYAGEQDEVDEHGLTETIGAQMAELADAMRRALESPSVERLRDPITVAIAGPANTGKSTLFNCLAERDLAIVSPKAGTTRDRVEVSLVRDGCAYLLVDTAGLNDNSVDAIELEGIRRARAAADSSDLLIWTGDEPPSRRDAIWLHMKADLPDRRHNPCGPIQSFSASFADSGIGVWRLLAFRAGVVLKPDGLAMSVHQRAVVRAVADDLMPFSTDWVMIAEALRTARIELGRLLGIDVPDALLDRLFSRFCLGK